MLPVVPAQAYIGPGAGVSAIGTLIALVVGVLLAVIGFVWYPFKRLLRKSARGFLNQVIRPAYPGTPARGRAGIQSPAMG